MITQRFVEVDGKRVAEVVWETRCDGCGEFTDSDIHVSINAPSPYRSCVRDYHVACLEKEMPWLKM